VSQMKYRTNWRLFLTFFWVGAFTFGGGYAMVPVVRKELVDKQGLLSDDDFVDAMSVIQGAPGALAINLATYCGNRLSGIAGAIAATLGAALPSYIILLAIASVFPRVSNAPILQAIFTGARPAILALIASAAYRFTVSCWRAGGDIVISLTALIALTVAKIHPAIVVAAMAAYGIISPTIHSRLIRRRRQA
jgi:chromate transporter